MISVRTFLKVMLRSALIVAFLSIPNPVVAFTGLRNWSRKALYTKVDLCTQSCYSQIIPGLYLSNARAAADRSVLTRLGITHVLTIEAKRLPKATFLNTNICTLFIRAYDTPQTNLMPYFPMANAFIDEGLKNGRVLVHCHFGVSRSATLVIAYLMNKYQLSFEDAFTYVRERRRFIAPNIGFVAQLKEYQRRNYDVKNVHKLEAFMNVHARKHRYKIASAAAVLFGLLVPAVAFIGLYISNARAASDHSLLRRLGVTHVLTVETKRLPNSTFQNTNMNTLYINARDSTDTELMCYFPIANAFIEDGVKTGNVIVHCHLGISRSPTLVIAYMMEKYKLTYQEAFAYVRRKRPFVNPNPNFVKQLKQYEQNRYYVSNYKRLEAYLKVNSGQNKIKVVSAAFICVGFIIPVVFLLL